MDSQRRNVEEIFFQAVPKEPAERLAFLDATCSDSAMRTRVEALLKAHDTAGNFLDGPAVCSAAPRADAQNLRGHDDDATCAHENTDFLEPCDTPNRLGLLAHYEILEILGRGGMGIVLRGVDVKLNRVVAIKVMTRQLAANAMARQRFLREAQAAAAISHHHVVAIHAVDEFNGLPYLVMEFVSGSSLQQKIDSSGALELAPILRLGTQIASGLAAAHAQGLVHRDIKPANILLENGIERVKISDFGLARSVDDARITQAGVVYGTPLYMSPEQAQGERLDQRSDLFSLGSVMYAMCTGRSPFRGETGLSVLKRVCDDTPRPIRDVNPNIPASLVEIVNKLLAKNPDARFQTANEVAELLSRYLAHLQHDPHTPFQGPGRLQPPAVLEERPDGSGENDRRGKPHFTRPRQRWPLWLSAAVFLMGIGVLAALEAARISSWTGLAAPRETPGSQAAGALAIPSKSAKVAAGAVDRPVKVFVLAGDSNMSGRVMNRLLKSNPARTKEYFQHLIRDERWTVREDVWIKNFNRKGSLTVGFGQTPDRLGPELEFGQVVGDHFDEQVLLIKTCWGSARLCGGFRTPSSGPAPEPVLEQLRQELEKEKANPTLADAEERAGAAYRDMLKEIRQTLASLGELFPTYQGQGFEIAGFVWFSGWTDMVNPIYDYAYTEHLANFIRDVRSDLNVPNLPFVIGQMGVGGGNSLGAKDRNFRALQAAVADLPEFTGNVKLVATDPYWDHEAQAVYKKGWENHIDEWDRVGSDFPYHYLGSAKTICLIGRAFGEAMIELRGSGAKN